MQVESEPISTAQENPMNESDRTMDSQNKLFKLEIDPNRPKYGRMIVLFQKGGFLISLGPDYICFISGFLFFCGLALILCYTVKSSFENQYVIYSAYTLSILQCGSYLIVALSNPCIAFREDNPIKQVTTENQFRVCKKCGAELKRKTYHCRQCDVCIQGYDHHCPWTSKCIGKGNLYQFYFFVTITPIYILCFMGLMMACLAVNATTTNNHLRDVNHPHS